MSHELRTPLNSLLILAKMLAENAERNLSPKQVEFAETIHDAGADLMTLINDILDLSKIESGTIQVEVDTCPVGPLCADLRRAFSEVATQKGLAFDVEVDASAPPALYTDGRRLQQVLKNLLSNAFKFTEKGRVGLRVVTARSGWSRDLESLRITDVVVAFEVTDTGIGIPRDKQRVIFEAFQQADGSTARRYGGTGLGLSISRELAHLLGGEIAVSSRPGEGSTFTLYVPRALVPQRAPNVAREPARANGANGSASGNGHDPRVARIDAPSVEDDRARLRPGDRSLLVVEQDAVHAGTLVALARERGFKVLVATRGEAALSLAREFHPDGITLDLVLPDMDGWALLDQLKRDAGTRQIPVHVISTRPDEHRLALRLGAVATLRKPATSDELRAAVDRLAGVAARSRKRLLVAAPAAQRSTILDLIGNGDVESVGVESGAEALEALRSGGPFDCIVLDSSLPEATAAELVRGFRGAGVNVPVVVYGPLAPAEERLLAAVSDELVLKAARSPEQLLDETALFLHRIEANLPEQKRQMLRRAHNPDPVLEGKTVLVVDDDVRNAFALTSMLERHRMRVVYAESGRAALDLVRKRPDV
ncbi:MAG TPA: ATP-binding protein, partial [Anaeromyxobacter sp.]